MRTLVIVGTLVLIGFTVSDGQFKTPDLPYESYEAIKNDKKYIFESIMNSEDLFDSETDYGIEKFKDTS